MTYQRGTAGSGNVTHYTSARELVLALTDKQARHHAVDCGSLRAARTAQHAFARRCDRLCRLLARDFPGCYLADGTMRPKAPHPVYHVSLWIVRGSTILREWRVSGCGTYVSVEVEQTSWPHRNCAWTEGSTSVLSAPHCLYTMAPAARYISRTPLHVYADAR